MSTPTSSDDEPEYTIEPCYGIAEDLSGQTVVVPLVACTTQQKPSKVILCGISGQGKLIKPTDSENLLEEVGVRTWLQGKNLKPLRNRPTYWQRSLVSAVSHISR